MKQGHQQASLRVVPALGSLGLLAQGWRGTMAWRQARAEGSQKEHS
ncbi:MAG: hypothetical protein RI565_07515 [Schleiferiaceae bacterium]|nr:hypothetical protein [Schleiferiaceae bacterium]